LSYGAMVNLLTEVVNNDYTADRSTKNTCDAWTWCM